MSACWQVRLRKNRRGPNPKAGFIQGAWLSFRLKSGCRSRQSERVLVEGFWPDCGPARDEDACGVFSRYGLPTGTLRLGILGASGKQVCRIATDNPEDGSCHQ